MIIFMNSINAFNFEVLTLLQKLFDNNIHGKTYFAKTKDSYKYTTLKILSSLFVWLVGKLPTLSISCLIVVNLKIK